MKRRRSEETVSEIRERASQLAERRESLRQHWEGFLYNCQKAHDDGNLAGLYDALVACSESDEDTKRRNYWGRLPFRLRPWDRIDVPRWVLDGAIEWMCREISSEGSCPTLAWKKSWLRDMRDFDRADAVENAREHGALWTDGKVYEEARERLLPKQTPGQLEGSYKRLKRRSRQAPGRYYLPSFITVGDKK